MRFTIVSSNHSDATILEDYRVLLRLLVEAAGHQADYDDHLCIPGTCYVLVDGFTTGYARGLEELTRRGAEAIIVATENITGDTFNRFAGSDDNDSHYGDRAYFQSRFEGFRACARHARAIWCAAPDPVQIGRYQALVGDVPVVPLPFPHFLNYPRVRHRPEKDIMLFFSGSPTPHRLSIMSSLAQGFRVSFLDVLAADHLRREFVARSKICLNLKQNAEWQFPSPMRYWYHLNNASFLLGEQCSIPCELDPYVPTLPAKQLGDACLGLLLGDQWSPLADEAHGRFAAERPGKAAAEELLDRSFSRCVNSARAAGSAVPQAGQAAADRTGLSAASGNSA